MTHRPLSLTLFPASALLLAACAAAPQRNAAPMATHQAREAVVNLAPASGSPVSGRLVLVPMGDGLHLRGEVGGLMPGSRHGFHIHEKGDCSAADASSAGGHFNPTGQPHGAHNSGKHHVGDMPELMTDASGTANISFNSSSLKLRGPNSIIGKAVIVHAAPDDVNAQPSGNAGARLVCGVIKQD